jgi:thymidylate synthase
MFRAFSGKSADQTWLQVMESLRSDPNAPVQESRGGPTQEILHAAISIENSVDRWVISRHPAINPAYAFAELIWTINGRDDSAFLTYFNSKLPELAGDGPTFHGAYGKRLRRQFGFDQFERAYHALRENPDSRQVVLQIWDGEIDLPTNDGKPVAADIPCNIVSLLKVRGGRLEWTQVMRSNDIFRGIPYDLVQFTFLQEIFSGWLGLKPGAYCHVSDSLHAYTKDIPHILAAVPVLPEPDTSKLTLPFKKSEVAFRQLAVAVDQIVHADSSAKLLLSTLHACKLPSGYKDMLAVLTSEGLRIRRNKPAYTEAIETCSNPLYRQLWRRWLARYPLRKKIKK